MSTLAILLFVVVAVLLVAAIVAVLLAARSTWRKGVRLVHELDGLSGEIGSVVGSQQQGTSTAYDG